MIEIVQLYLVANGYDGLSSDVCACKADDLAPCGAIGGDCQAGYLAPCPPDCGDHDWHISPIKEDK